MFKKVNSKENRQKRHKRIRKNLAGTANKPRLCVFKSNKNIYAQLIDDVSGKTIVSASTLDKDLRVEANATSEDAKKVGQAIGKKAVEKGIEECVFDRSGYIYHGKVKELADGARESGLKF
ncbi:MAG: 50S ribosomal protein L18 [Finegoldia sp.]|nr:50S ribosomal protein L18 [Finegoldia sp.]